MYHPHFLPLGICNHLPSTCYIHASRMKLEVKSKTWPIITGLALHGQIIMTVYITDIKRYNFGPFYF
jgi:hypothetical protein